MAGPVRRGDLFGDQPVAGLLVRGPQQGLSQAHQSQTLAGRQAEFLEEAFDHPLAAGRGACGPDQGLGLGLDGRPVLLV